MTRYLTALLLVAALSGCAPTQTSVPPPVASEAPVQTPQQQARAALERAHKAFAAKDFRTAREQARLAAGMFQMAGADGNSPRTLAARASHQLKEWDAALADLGTLPAAELSAAILRDARSAADKQLASGRRELSAGRVAAALQYGQHAVALYTRYNAPGAVRAAAHAHLAACYERSGQKALAQGQMVLASKVEPQNPRWRQAVASYDRESRAPGAEHPEAQPTGISNPAQTANDYAKNHGSWQQPLNIPIVPGLP